jgi:hypothetical protein
MTGAQGRGIGKGCRLLPTGGLNTQEVTMAAKKAAAKKPAKKATKKK